MAMNGSEFSNKSLEVHSDDGKFVLQVFSKRDGYAEGLLAIPIQQMNGTNKVNKTVYEFVVATFCAVGGYCQIAIAAVENNTEVFVDIPEKVEEIALCNKSSFFRSHRDKAFTMNKFDALQLETTYDLTGTVIFSFKPIAVFVGSRNVTNGGIVAHTMEQLVPSSHWGTEFVVQTLGSNGYGDILKIVSHYTSTVVTMSGFPSFNMTERYQTVTRRLSNGTRSHIQASHPIQVIQISGLTYAAKDEISMLSMTVVPSVQNSWHSFQVACPDSYSTTQFQIVSGKTSNTYVYLF
ncbi:IgGFc-binding protein-like [Ruditapes philippinarum]|uniref:IgGFc-binding protein-like n=1 Tax=Ruditapes philippinarum TaxID=129788 RepID=UPI00295A906C|nr:IgGFc-binding protein-like [Ruditapes philippinarum]